MITSFITYLRYNKGYSENTLRSYENDLRDFARYINTTNPGTSWRAVKKQMIDAFVSKMVADGHKPATIKQHVSTLRTFYKTCYAMGMQINNPARYVSTPKLEESLPKAIPIEDIRATVHDESIDWRARAIITVLTETGIRLQELLDMRPEDIDQANHSIKVRGKGRKERTVYYGSGSEKWLSLQPWHGMDQRTVRHLVYEALSKHSDAKQLSPHALRHSFATTMLNNGGRLETLSALLGHQDTKITERYAKMGTSERKAQYEACMPSLSFAEWPEA